MLEPAQYDGVVFWDVNAGETEEILNSFHPRLKVVPFDHRLHRASDSELIKFFEREARDKYPNSKVFVVTHDRGFERETGFRPLESPIAIIKIPSPSLGPSLFKYAIESLKMILLPILNAPRSVKVRGVVEIE